ncbi:hypothetical protein DL240_04360 [Lujinxingia litoralis]|uniref:Ribosomal RNA large subunit methyltransferase H n=1 Tax=Lujinxingia litoralis TaxID=2211119 RepID=A0A328CCP2_9DELT|nr:23S rRNA (pseudouridine(1915)-N(3))-methyltransferase RlmH [Lujinxingia litoralis]RAL25450.1 hypothetical protein DL240_04360 [Lujinxingia litoralis]
MKISVVAVGKMREGRLGELAREYRERLAHHLPVEDIEVREARVSGHDVAGALAEEAEAMRKVTPEGALTIAMMEGGKQIDSHQLAEWMDEWMVSGQRHVVFYIGSAHGLDRPLCRESQRRLSLSKMTFPHEMARMMLWEQLYRAMTIIRGEPYHK